ncbi:MarR family winged helix-turn-helix transcriptional regulator [Micromonospora sp. NPDC003776]
MTGIPDPTRGATGDRALVAARDLVVVFSRLRRRLRGLRAEDGLSPSQTSVLKRLEESGPTTASELAAVERVRPQSMAATVAVLVDRGLVRRDPDPDDARRQRLALSDAGRAWISDTRRLRDEWLATALQKELNAAELDTVIRALALVERATLR